MAKRARDLLQNVSLSLASVTVFTAALELVCRVIEPAKPKHPMAELILDWKGWDGEFYTVKTTAVGQPPWEDYNQDGMRDREHALEKPPGLQRLVVLGDSTTFGFWLPPDEAFPQVLQDLLDAQGRSVEVFNIALPGWTTRQELIAYRKIARKYRPDRVLLAICLNDIPEMQNNLTRPPPFVMDLFKRSALVRRLVLLPDREIQDEMEMLRNMDLPKVRQGFELMFKDLRALRKEAEADGARLGLLILPFRFQFRADAPPPLVQRRILDFCAAERLPCLDLLPPLRPLGEAAFHDFDHFNTQGSRLVAERILESGIASEAVVAAPSPPPSASELIAALHAVDEKERVAAAWALGGVDDSEASVGALVERLKDESARVRAGAAWSLGRIGQKAQAAAAAPLVARLDDEDDAVRWRAVSALGQIHPEVTAELGPLLRVLGESGGRGRALAAKLVGEMGPRAVSAVPVLVAALGDPREVVRWRSAWALGQIGPDAAAAVPALAQALADPDLRWRVADALGQIGEAAKPAVPSLVSCLDDPNSSVRWRVAEALERIGPGAREAVPALVRHATDPDMKVRLGALRALERAGPDVSLAVDVYRRALHDDNWTVRTQAANALGRLGPAAQAAARDLLGLLRDDGPGVRAKAIRALGRLGALPPEATQALLVVAAGDADEAVRAAAQKALVKAEPVVHAAKGPETGRAPDRR
jgi:HEAT repeat protein/lysophospholipase L1-like esterase